MKRSALLLILIGLIVTLFSNPVQAAPPVTVQINGSVVNTPTDMDIIEGQVMVPLRWAAEQLGSNSIQWDSATRTVAIKSQQDFYNIEKLASYACGLQTGPEEREGQIWPLPDRVKNLALSHKPNRKWILRLDQFTPQQLDPAQPPDNICIRITSDDGSYEHSSAANSIVNHQGHYYLPMDWLEYLFKAKVNYDQTTNVLSIQTPDSDKIKSEIALIENTLIPASADEAIKLWGRGEQVRNGALQYAVLSPQLRQEADKSNYVRQSYWVTGGSSPSVGPITIINRDELSDTKIEYTLSFPEITSNPPYTTATEKMVVEKLLYTGQEGWYITQILQSSDYGVIENVGVDSKNPINVTNIDWQVLAGDYNPPDIGGLLAAIKDSNITKDGSIVINYNIKREFNQMGEDYRFFFMPKVAWYDFESIGAAMSYILFTWTGEFGTFPDKAPQYQAEARLRKIFAAPNNEYPLIKHQPYMKSVVYDGAAYKPWPESYNSNTMIYDLIELKERHEGDYTYYTATANEHGFDVNAYYEAGENEKFLFANSKAMGLDYNAVLEKLLENGDIIHAEKSQTYIIEFRIQDNNMIPMIVSVDKLY